MVKGLKAFAAIAFILLLTACGQQAEAPDEDANDLEEGVEEMNGWNLEVTTTDGEQELNVDMVLTNDTGDAQEIEFPTSQTYELVLTNESEEEVYRFSDGMMFTMAIISEEVGNGESLSYKEAIPTTDIEEGTYSLEVTIVGKTKDEEELPTATIDVEI